jgi:hypothetical protein
MPIHHTRTVSDPASPEVGADDWNAEHTNPDVADVTGLEDALDGKQPLATVLTNTTAAFTTEQETKLAGIEASADVTDATNVNAAGAVMESDYTPSHSILVQQSGTGSPEALQIGNNTLVGRLSGGGSAINDLSVTDVRSLLSINNLDNTSDANKPISDATQTALDAKQDTLTVSSDISINTATIPASATVTPDLPSSGSVTLFGRVIGGKSLPAFVGAIGIDTALQPHLGRNKISLVTATGNGSTLTAIGALANAATGTAATEGVALTTNYTKFKRMAYHATASATNAVAGFRAASSTTARQYWNEKGYHIIVQWGISVGVTGNTSSRAFCGMIASVSAPTDVEPSTLTDIIGMGWDGGDTNIQVMHNDSSGTATKIDLGASFPKPTVDATNMYELALFARPNGDVDYEVRELLTSNVATGTITTDKSSQAQRMTIMGYTSAGGVNAVRSKFGFVQYYSETDY